MTPVTSIKPKPQSAREAPKKLTKRDSYCTKSPGKVIETKYSKH